MKKIMTSFAIAPSQKLLLMKWAKEEEKSMAEMIRKLIEREAERREQKNLLHEMTDGRMQT